MFKLRQTGSLVSQSGLLGVTANHWRPANLCWFHLFLSWFQYNELLTFAGGSVWRTRRSCSAHHHWTLCSSIVFSPALETSTRHNAAAATDHALAAIQRGPCPPNFYRCSRHRQQQRRPKILRPTSQTARRCWTHNRSGLKTRKQYRMTNRKTQRLHTTRSV